MILRRKRATQQIVMRSLVVEAHKRGDTLADLAAKLGVTYERLAQWRRGDADIKSARRESLERAAEYLGIPTALILVMSDNIGLRDFLWPSDNPNAQLQFELNKLSEDPFLGSFVPIELETAEPAVQRFVIFLFYQVRATMSAKGQEVRWSSLLKQAAEDCVAASLHVNGPEAMPSTGIDEDF